MKKMTYLNVLAMLFGMCGGVICAPGAAAKKKAKTGPTASSSAMVVYQQPAVDHDGDTSMEAYSPQADDAAAGLQAAIQNIGAYADEIARTLADMGNTLGAALDKSAETVASLDTDVNSLSADVDRATTRMEVISSAQ